MSIDEICNKVFVAPDIDNRKIFRSIPGGYFKPEYVDELERGLIMCVEYPSMAKEVAEGIIERYNILRHRKRKG